VTVDVIITTSVTLMSPCEFTNSGVDTKWSQQHLMMSSLHHVMLS